MNKKFILFILVSKYLQTFIQKVKIMANFTERQRQIIDESIKIIANSGIQNLTIKNISKEIGISEAAIYRHFDSKFSILMAILESFENSAQTILDQIDSKKNCIEQIGDFLSDRYANFAAEPNISRVMFSDEIFQNDKRLSAKIASIVHSHKEKLVHCIQQGQAKNEIRNDIPPKDIFRISINF